MARVTIEDCLDKVSNRFTLVILVAKRLRQLLKGDQPLVDANNKNVVIALREVEAGKLAANLSRAEMADKLELVLKRNFSKEKAETESEKILDVKETDK